MASHRCRGLALLAALALTQSCARHREEAARSQVAGADVQLLNASAQFLAGIPGRSDGPFRRFEQTPAWRSYSADISTRWAQAEKDQFAAVNAFEKRELEPLKTGSSFVFYPFSGPDVLYLTHFFPEGKVYVLAGLERVGEVRKLDYKGTNLERELQGWNKALSSIFNRSFFVTSEMDSEFHGRVANGLLPMILLLLARSGHSLESVRYGHLDSASKFIPEPADGQVRHMGVEIIFHTRVASSKLYYFSTNLGPEFGEKLAFSRFLHSLGRSDTLVKSASFLLHWKMCSVLREYILENSNLILEDDTGIPYHYFQNADWQVRLFGEYSRPDHPFRSEYQPDLAEAFQNAANVRPLGFSLGYGYGRRPSSLILAKRVTPASGTSPH